MPDGGSQRDVALRLESWACYLLQPCVIQNQKGEPPSIPMGDAATPTASFLTRNVSFFFFFLHLHALISGRRKKQKPMWVTAFRGKDKGASSLAKPEQQQRKQDCIYLCALVSHYSCCSPENKVGCCWVTLRHCLKLLINWATRELFPRCWQDGCRSHLHVQILIHSLATPFMPEKGIRQCDITLNFFVRGIYASSHIKWFTGLIPTNQKNN